MRLLIKAMIAAFAALFGLGLAMTTAASAGEDAKREDDVREVVTVEYDDRDDDTGTGTQSRSVSVSRTSMGSVNSKVSNDGTNSRFTGVSRDKDRSRADLTKDWTNDGGDRTRDRSKDSTNDKSRHDTR